MASPLTDACRAIAADMDVWINVCGRIGTVVKLTTEDEQAVYAMRNQLDPLPNTPAGMVAGLDNVCEHMRDALLQVGVLGFLPRMQSDALRITEAADFLDNPTSPNQPPTITAPGLQTGPRDTPLDIAGISVADPDDATLTVYVGAGPNILGIDVRPGATLAGDGTTQVQISGTIALVNVSLSQVTVTPNTGYTGGALINITVEDGTNAAVVDQVFMTFT